MTPRLRPWKLEDRLNGSRLGVTGSPGDLPQRDSVVRRYEPKRRRRQLRGERQVGIEKPGAGTEARWTDQALVEAKGPSIIPNKFVLARSGSSDVND